jgi:hypothetical protein
MSNIETSFITTIARSDLSNVALEAAEVGIDSVLDEGLLNDIPVLSTIKGLIKTGGAIKEYLYIKKICRFLGPLNAIPQSERIKFINILGDSEQERTRAGENILLIIDRLDNTDKPKILGCIFRDYLLGNISKTQFMLLAKSLELLNLAYVPNLISYYHGPYDTALIKDDVLQQLATSGLVGMYFGSGALNGGGGGYKKCDLGELFTKYISD